MEHTRRVLFDSMQNFRDLGGWPTPEGPLRYGLLYRADLPWHLTEADRRRIRGMGLGVSLDLRDEPEQMEMPDELREIPGVDYRPMPMLGVEKAKAETRPGKKSAFAPDFFWGDEYIRMLENNRPWVGDCIRYLAAEERSVVFHCFTGKDRTGILAALVLSLCGVPAADVAADYSVSQIYLRPVYEWMRTNLDDFRGTEVTYPFYSTDGANILAVLDHLRENYGGTEAFLIECGAEKDCLERLRERLIKKA